MLTSASNQMARYAAKLLFQFRVVRAGCVNKRRVCEERIIHIKASSPESALKIAKKRGRDEQTSYSDRGNKVFIEFVGVLGLIKLGVESESDEVWWELVERVRPMERRKRLVPKENTLAAMRPGTPRKHGRRLVP